MVPLFGPKRILLSRRLQNAEIEEKCLVQFSQKYFALTAGVLIHMLQTLDGAI